MAYSQKQWERMRIAFGVNALTGSTDDWRGRAAELKGWDARWNTSTKASGGWYKSVTGGPAQMATKSYGSSVPRVPAFDWRYVTDHNPGNATKSLGGVSLKSDGIHLYAAEERVISVRDAGMSPMLAPLVKLTTVSGKSFIVERAALRPPE